MGRSRFFAALVVTFALLLEVPAQAQETTDAEARALYEAGEIAFTDGRWEAALGYFQQSYALSHRPELLFNIGSSAEHLRQDETALRAFRQYLEAVPDAGNRVAVESRIAVLERAVAVATSTAETTTTTTETHEAGAPTPSSTGSDPAPWIVLGVGGALAVAGAVLLIGGYVDIGSVSGARDGVPLGEISGPHDAAPILTGTGWAVLGVGVAVAAIGLGWGLSAGTGDTRVSGTAWVDGQSGGILLRGTL